MTIIQISIFSLCTLVNVMLSTCKSVLTVKASRRTAAIINAISYGFYTIVLKQITGAPLLISFTVTLVANLIGVYSSLWILDKTKKDKLWKIEVTIPKEYTNTVHFELKEVPHSYIEGIGKYTLFNFYCESQKESCKVKEIIVKYDAKYFISEAKGNF